MISWLLEEERLLDMSNRSSCSLLIAIAQFVVDLIAALRVEVRSKANHHFGGTGHGGDEDSIGRTLILDQAPFTDIRPLFHGLA